MAAESAGNLAFPRLRFLPPHADAPHWIAASALTEVKGDTVQTVGSETLAYVNVKKKIIYVTVYGHPDDLEWTRKVIAAWVPHILKLNGDTAEPPTQQNQPSWIRTLSPWLIASLALLVAAWFLLRKIPPKRPRKGT